MRGFRLDLSFLLLTFLIPITARADGASPSSPAAKLTANPAGYLGESIAISGDTVVAGARGDSRDFDQGGAAYVFVRTAAGWVEQQRLTANDAAAGDQFGSSVAISGDTIVVGAMNDDDGANNAGSAYVFTRDGNTWTLQQKLKASDPGAGASFGLAAAIDGNTIVIGSPLDGHAGIYSGSAYVFVRNGTTWTQQQKLTGSNTAAVDRFGFSVAISGETIVAGAPTLGIGTGQAYVFSRNGSTWIERQKLTASDAAPGAMFGLPVRIDGQTIAAGSARRASGGAIYIFERGGSGWTQQQIIGGGYGFGFSIAVHGDTLVGGAQGQPAHLFTRIENFWAERQTLIPGNPPPINTQFAFGYSAAISDHGWIVISDPYAGSFSGAAYVFEPDVEPPVITSIRTDPDALWPPNHKLIPVTVTVAATDNAGTPRCRIISVESNAGDASDWEITGDLTVRLRAERAAKGGQRIYIITVQCEDEAGNIAVGRTSVRVSAQ